MSDINTTMTNCYPMLQEANEFGLLTEVVVTSISYAQENPDASIEDCLSYGFNEWVK